MSPTVAERCNILLPLNSEDTFSFFLNIFWLWRLWLKMPQLLRLCFDHNKSDFSCGQHSNEAGGPTLVLNLHLILILVSFVPLRANQRCSSNLEFFGFKCFFFGVKVSTEGAALAMLSSDFQFRFFSRIHFRSFIHLSRVSQITFNPWPIEINFILLLEKGRQIGRSLAKL